MKKPNFEFISKIATEVGRNWSNAQVAQFHYFNPNGLYAQKKASDEAISNAVDAGQMRSGALIAYGSFNDFHSNEIARLALLKFVNNIRLQNTLRALARDIEKAKAELAQVQQ